MASSTPGLGHALAIQANLEPRADVVVWQQSVFAVSTYPLEALEQAARESDYGVFVVTPDDLRTGSGRRVSIPRDNVMFEFGLFVGVLGRQRSFLVAPSDVPDLRLPTDLEGFVQARYKHNRSDGNLTAALGPACTSILNAIAERERDAARSASHRVPTPLGHEAGRVLDRHAKVSLVHQTGRVSPSYTAKFLEGAEHEITIVGFSLKSFIGYFDSRPQEEIRASISAALERGARVSLLFLNPDSPAARLFAKQRSDNRMLGDIRRSIDRAQELRVELLGAVKRGKFDLRVFDQMPFGHVKRVDDASDGARLMCFPYLPGVRRADTPYLEVYRSANQRLYAAHSGALSTAMHTSRTL